MTIFTRTLCKKAILKAIDSNWIKQVDHLQRLKNSVNTRQNGKRNPIFEYHKVALESFELMTDAIKKRHCKVPLSKYNGKRR